MGDSVSINTERVRVAIVDDHDAIRLGFKVSCEGYNFDLLASEASVDALVAALGDARPEVVVLDLSLSDGSLVEDNVTRVRELGCQVLIFSIADKRNLVRIAIKAGGYQNAKVGVPLADIILDAAKPKSE
ncbi:MAG: DNA-binding response regulator [Microbacteriaceae bacterium]|nr:DNA-binding response regulator [Microbacteriaceae bacterium]